jgi:hypothetical protein
LRELRFFMLVLSIKLVNTNYRGHITQKSLCFFPMFKRIFINSLYAMRNRAIYHLHPNIELFNLYFGYSLFLLTIKVYKNPRLLTIIGDFVNVILVDHQFILDSSLNAKSSISAPTFSSTILA